jgi:hypothetical protein
MARTILLEHGGFRIGERVELTQQGEQQVAGVRCKTGTVVGFGNHSTLHVLVDGNSLAASFPAALWRAIKNGDE